MPIMPCGCMPRNSILVVRIRGFLLRKSRPSSQILIQEESNIAHSQWNIEQLLSKMISNAQGIGWTGDLHLWPPLVCSIRPRAGLGVAVCQLKHRCLHSASRAKIRFYLPCKQATRYQSCVFFTTSQSPL